MSMLIIVADGVDRNMCGASNVFALGTSTASVTYSYTPPAPNFSTLIRSVRELGAANMRSSYASVFTVFDRSGMSTVVAAPDPSLCWNRNVESVELNPIPKQFVNVDGSTVPDSADVEFVNPTKPRVSAAIS